MPCPRFYRWFSWSKTWLLSLLFVVAISLLFLGLLSAAMGFAAEAMRTWGTNVEYPSSGCGYVLTPGQILATASCVSLFLATIIFETAVDCQGGRPPDQQNSYGTRALICLIGSWLTCVSAVLLLLTGVSANFYLNRLGCYVVKPGTFAGGAALSLGKCSFEIHKLLYIDFNKEHSSSNTPEFTSN